MSASVSVLDSHSSNSLLHKQFRLEAGVGIGQVGGAFRYFQCPSAMSSPPEACSLKTIEHPYTQAFLPFGQALLLRSNKPSNTPQLLSQNSFPGTFTGTKSNLY